ncbi:MAG: hypothetical protein QNI91_19045 [Arenicellales bacterium]|nr:hypothetical protein [Arenicellales bacterium]
MTKAIGFSAAILCAAMVLLGGISEIFSLNGTSANTVYKFLLVGLPTLGFFYAIQKTKGKDVTNAAQPGHRKQKSSKKPSRRSKKAR